MPFASQGCECVELSVVPARRWATMFGGFAGPESRVRATVSAAAACWVLACLAGWSAGVVLALLWLPVAVLAALFAARRDAAATGGDGGDTLPAALAADAVILRFEPGGEVGDVSQSARPLLGLAPELLLAGGLFERLHVADRVAFLCAMADVRHGAEPRRVELRLRLPGAARETFGAFALDLAQTGDGRWPVAGLLRVDAGAQGFAAERDAAVAELAAVREAQAKLIAALGHELRTPLNAVIGFAEMLGSERLSGCADPRQRDYAGIIQGCGAHLLRVADAMLEAGRLESGGRALEPEALDIAETAALCRSMLALQAGERGVRLVSRVAADERIALDRRIVQQVLVNLLSNAVKFTPPGGLVTIEAQRTGRELRLSVSDTGPGMEEAELRDAGAAFASSGTRGRGKPEGAGIGLGLVRRLMALHGGSLRLDTRPGTGLVATAAFPLFSAAPGETDARPLAAAVPDTERNRHGPTRKTA